MLAIRMQRVGRSGHAQFRMIVQDRRFHPTSGRVVEYLGSYNPHSKESNFDKEKLESYLAKGAQPSARVVKLLKSQKIKMPEWVKEPVQKKKAVRNPAKRRSTRPEVAPEPEAKTPAEEAPAVTEESPKAATGESTTEAEAPAETPEATTESQAEESQPVEAAKEPKPEEAKAEPEPAQEPKKPAEK